MLDDHYCRSVPETIDVQTSGMRAVPVAARGREGKKRPDGVERSHAEARTLQPDKSVSNRLLRIGWRSGVRRSQTDAEYCCRGYGGHSACKDGKRTAITYTFKNSKVIRFDGVTFSP